MRQTRQVNKLFVQNLQNQLARKTRLRRISCVRCNLLHHFSNYRKTPQSRTPRSAWTFCEFGPCITISKICVNKEVHPQTGFFKRRTEGACMTFCSSSGRGTASFERQWTTPGHTHCPRWQIANEKNLSHSVWSGRSTVVKHFIKSLLFGFIHTLGWKDTNKHAHKPPKKHTITQLPVINLQASQSLLTGNRCRSMFVCQVEKPRCHWLWAWTWVGGQSTAGSTPVGGALQVVKNKTSVCLFEGWHGEKEEENENVKRWRVPAELKRDANRAEKQEVVSERPRRCLLSQRGPCTFLSAMNHGPWCSHLSSESDKGHTFGHLHLSVSSQKLSSFN